MRKNMIVPLLALMLLLLAGTAMASGVTTDRLNFHGSEDHTVTLTNTEGLIANASITMPAGFTFVSSVDGCTNPSGQNVVCNNIADAATASFIMSSTASGVEYTLYDMTSVMGSTTLNNISYLNIRDDEIFHTLVEYGRGRGNYFYDSMGTATSAGTGTGYNYVPNGTAFELNYLHKVFNIKQYYSLATSDATDVEFTCVYPYHTVVREHLVSGIGNDGLDWSVDYSIPRVEGSWERMGFLGMDIDDGEYDVADTFVINCSTITYDLDDAYGSIVVAEDSFDMEVRSPDPLSVSATSSATTIGNGTTEALITYTFTNDEVYPLDGLQLDIEAPELSQFIGVRGELFGSALDKYTYELTTLAPSESIDIALVARFDTSASADVTLDLSQGINAKFVPTWELNSYNPMSYLQALTVTDTLTVNYGLSAAITNLATQIDNIEQNTIAINTTVSSIYDIVIDLNSSMDSIEATIAAINTTVNNIDSTVTEINTTIDGFDTSLSVIETTVTDINGTINTFETTLNEINGTVNIINQTVTSIDGTVTTIDTNVDTVISDIGDLSTLISSIETNIVNNITSSEANIISTLNASIGNVRVNLTEVLDELDYMQGFNEELIFLVTDSVGMAEEAQVQLNNGDTVGAIESLQIAAENLEIVDKVIDDDRAKLVNKYNMKTADNVFQKIGYWVEGIFI